MQNHLVIIAGPGAGKTQVLTQQILLTTKLVPPTSIAAVTFTNAAAHELASRLHDAGLSKPIGYIGTLHGLMALVLSAYRAKLAVIDDETAGELRSQCAAELALEKKVKMSGVRNLLLDREGLLESEARDPETLVAKAYLHKLTANSLVDFDGLLHEGLEVLKEYPDRRFSTLFVDEAQDASALDWAIYHRVAARIVMVGDPDQCIYTWRGADPMLLVTAAREGGYERLLMEQNFRCPPAVCQCANSLIAHNRLRYEKRSLPVQGRGGEVAAERLDNLSQEINAIWQRLCHLGEMHRAVVLLRTNDLVTRFMQELRASKYARGELYGDCYEKPLDWPKLLRFLHVLEQPGNDVLAERYLAVKRDKAFAKFVAQEAAQSVRSINEIELHLEKPKSWAQLLRYLNAEDFSPVTTDIVQRSVAMFDEEWPDLPRIIQAFNEPARREHSPGLLVTTLHAAKGRQWETVILPAWDEGVLPLGRGNVGPRLEEERRLAFVGVTRAQRNVFITSNRERAEPSRFIAELGLRVAL